jgi:phenylpropionate dioxygenase-like ring-hydroxylating dioxygenase large terminal subunit
MTLGSETSKLESLIEELSVLAEVPLAKARVMPRQVYLSEEFLAREEERIFHQEWLCAGREDDIPEVGDFITYQIGLQPIIVVRLSNQSIHAMANVCRHRMMRLVEGRGNAKRFACPYHGWTYRIDGQLINAPHMECTAGFDKKQVTLPTIRCETWGGWIYVTLNSKAESVADRLHALEPVVAKYRMERYVGIFSEDREWNTNWKLLCENFMEGYHLPVAHRSTVGKNFPVRDTIFDSRGAFDGFTYQCFTKPDDLLIGVAHPRNRKLHGDWRRTSVMPTVFPSHMYVLAPDHLWYLSVQPKGPSEVSIRYGVALAPEVFKHHPNVKSFIDEIQELLGRVQEEDRILVEAILKGAQAPLAQRGPLSWLEREIHEFIQYLARQLV